MQVYAVAMEVFCMYMYLPVVTYVVTLLGEGNMEHVINVMQGININKSSASLQRCREDQTT